MRRAGTALARRARSEAELARSLAAVAPPEGRLASGWGTLRVQADLQRLEIVGDAARAGMAAAGQGERAAAERLLARRVPDGDLRRGASLLARRGFGEDVAEAVLHLDLE